MSSPQRKIFAVYGMLPEPMGYSLAKFSRSSKSYKQWANDLTSADAEKFYDTYYFDYGHASIADLVHVPIVVEGISEIVAFEMWENPLIDGQQASTRYQDFSRRNIIIPPELKDTGLEEAFIERCTETIQAYNEMKAPVIERFKATKIPPVDMDKDKAERTYNARSFDVTRYLLPQAISTGQGQIMNARTVEKMLRKMFASPLREVVETATEMKAALMQTPPYNPNDEKLKEILKDYPEIYEKVKELLGFNKPLAPTIIKYATANEYILQTYPEFAALSREMFKDDPSSLAHRGVELFAFVDPEIDLISSMLYKVSQYPYGYIKKKVETLTDSERGMLIKKANENRAKWDPLPEEARTNILIYDVCIDVGASRDLNRHRNLVKINQPLTPFLGWSIPQPTNDKNMLKEIGWETKFNNELRKSFDLAREIYKFYPAVSAYPLQMAANRRMLLKMDPQQLEYMTNDRTSVEGHFSYREIVYSMYELYKEIWPTSASIFRVTNPSVEEFFRR